MKRTFLLLAGACALLTAAGCAIFTDPLPMADARYRLDWPPAPEAPRIRFLRTIAGAEDIVPPPGRVQQMVEVVTGEKRQYLDFITPAAIGTDGDYRIYVVDTAARLVHCLDLERREVNYIIQAGDESFASPVGIAVDDRGILYVSDSVRAKVYKFNRQLQYLGELKSPQEPFQRPSGIAINRHGEKYVVDVLANKLVVFDREDRFLGDFPEPAARAEFNRPIAVAIDRDDHVYVTDAMNFAVKIFDRSGAFLGRIGQIGDAPGSFARPKGVAVDSGRHIYIVDSTFDNFQIFDQQGRLLLHLGRSGSRPGEFFMPSGIHIDLQDRIFLADTYNHRIQIFQYLNKGITP